MGGLEWMEAMSLGQLRMEDIDRCKEILKNVKSERLLHQNNMQRLDTKLSLLENRIKQLEVSSSAAERTPGK